MSIIKLPSKKDFSGFCNSIESYQGSNCVLDYEDKDKIETVEYKSCNLFFKRVRDKKQQAFFAKELGNIFLAKEVENRFFGAYRGLVKGLENFNSMSLKDVDIYMVTTELKSDSKGPVERVPLIALCLDEEYFLPHLDNYSGKYVSGLKLAILAASDVYQSVLHSYFDCLTDKETKILKQYCTDLAYLAELVDPDNDLTLY